MLVATELWDAAALALLTAAATGLGADLKIGLNTATITPTKNLTIADMVEPTYTIYARQAVVLGTPQRDQTYDIVGEGAGNPFVMGDALFPTLVQGWFLTYGAGPLLLGYCPLPQPFQMNDALDVLNIIVQYIQSCAPQGTAVIIL